MSPEQRKKDKKERKKNKEPSAKEQRELALQAFLESESNKPKVLVIDGLHSIHSVYGLLKLHRKEIQSILVIDNPGALYDNNIPIIDMDRVTDGQWQRKTGFSESAIPKILRKNESSQKLSLLKRIERPKKSLEGAVVGLTRSANRKARGELHKLVLKVKDRLADNRQPVLRRVFGYCVGVEKKSNFEKAVEVAEKCGVTDKEVASILKFFKSPRGKELSSVFYLCMGKKKKFRTVQNKYKALSVNDWSVLTEYLPITSAYRWISKPYLE